MNFVKQFELIIKLEIEMKGSCRFCSLKMKEENNEYVLCNLSIVEIYKFLYYIYKSTINRWC